MEEEIEYPYPYYRFTVWMSPEDDLTDLFGFMEHLKKDGTAHALAFGVGENLTKYALWVVGKEIVRSDVRSRIAPNSEPMGEIIYKSGNIQGVTA